MLSYPLNALLASRRLDQRNESWDTLSKPMGEVYDCFIQGAVSVSFTILTWEIGNEADCYQILAKSMA